MHFFQLDFEDAPTLFHSASLFIWLSATCINIKNKPRFVIWEMTNQTRLDFCFRTLIYFAPTHCSEWLAANRICVPTLLWFYQLYINWSVLFAPDFTQSKIQATNFWKFKSSTNSWDEKICWCKAIKALICGETLAQSLCTFTSLIHCAAGVYRECWLFGAAQHSTIIGTDYEILCEYFCWFWECIWAGHIQTVLPRRLFCLGTKNKWQYSMAAPILVKRWGGGWGKGWSAFYGGAVIMILWQTWGELKEGHYTARGETCHISMMSLKRVCGFFFLFSCTILGLQHRNVKQCASVQHKYLSSLSSLCCSFPCSIGIPPDSSPAGWHSAISSQK